MVRVKAGERGGGAGVQDVHPLGPLEPKVAVQVHAPAMKNNDIK